MPRTGADISKRLESVKHLLWHGNTEEALERLANLAMDLSVIQARSAAAEKIAASVTEFEIYIRNNRDFIRARGDLSLPTARHGYPVNMLLDRAATNWSSTNAQQNWCTNDGRSK